MKYISIKLTLKELNTGRIVVREIDGSNFIMEDGEIAMTRAEQECEILFWMDARGEEQHNSKLDLIEYEVVR